MSFAQEVLADNPVEYWRFNNPEGVKLDGSTGYISTPDAAALTVAGDLDIRVKVRAVDWASATLMVLAGKDAGSPNREWALTLITGFPRLYHSSDGINWVMANSTVAVPFGANQPGWVRATLDVDNGASGHDVKFWTSSDGITFTQLGITVTVAGVTFQIDTSAGIGLGANAAGSSPFNGTIYQFEYRNGINGPVILSFNADGNQQATSNTWVDTSGGTSRTWTLQAGANPVMPSRRVGAQTNGVAGTYVSAPSQASLNVTTALDIRALVLPNGSWTSLPTNSCFISKSPGMWTFFISTAGVLRMQVSDGTTDQNYIATAAVTLTNGVPAWVRGTFEPNVAGSYNAKFYQSPDGVTWTQIGSTLTGTARPISPNGSGSTIPIGIGANSGGIGNQFNGNVWFVQVRDGVNGTVVAEFNPSKAALNTDFNYSQRVLRDLPVGYWKLDEPSGTTATDSSGNGYNLTYAGSPTLGAPGAIVNDPSTACNFGGANGKYASRAATPALNPSGSFSFECWLNYNALDTAQMWIFDNSPDNATTSGWAIATSGAGTPTLNFRMCNGAGAVRSTATTSNLANIPNQWHHVVGVYDASLDKIVLYLNGVIEGASGGTGTGRTLASSPIPAISKYAASNNYTFRGAIAHAALYNTALSLAQVSDHYLAGRGFLPYGTGTVDDAYGNTFTLQGKARYVSGPNEATTAAKPALGRQGLLSESSNGAVRLTATSFQYITVPYSPALNPPSFSWEAWIQPATISTQYLCSCTTVTTGTTGFAVYIDSTGRIIFRLNGTDATPIGATTLVAGGVYHLVCTSTPTAQTVYINGNLTATTALAYTPNLTNALWLGCNQATAIRYDGIMDEVALYPSVLSAARVHQHFVSGRNQSWGPSL